jgi:hypothetical protein
MENNPIAAPWPYVAWPFLDEPEMRSVPIDERCWRCDIERMHRGCEAGLCEDCCRELRSAA